MSAAFQTSVLPIVSTERTSVSLTLEPAKGVLAGFGGMRRRRSRHHIWFSVEVFEVFVVLLVAGVCHFPRSVVHDVMTKVSERSYTV